MGEVEFEQFKSICSGISPTISAMLSLLIQDPGFSLEPYFFTIIIIGFANFMVSLIRFTEKKHNLIKNIWHITGIGLAGFVLVHWAKYYSGKASIIMEISIIAMVVIISFYFANQIRQRYRNYTVLIYLGLVISIVIPVMAMLPFEKPIVVVSPLSKFVTFSTPGMNQTVDININSTIGNAHNIQLTAEPYSGNDNTFLALYLDGKEKGPIEIPYLARGKGESSILRIETSPKIPPDTYYILLNFTYEDLAGNAYSGSNDVEVTVINVSGRPTPIGTYQPGFGIVTAIITLAVVIMLRRSRFRKDH